MPFSRRKTLAFILFEMLQGWGGGGLEEQGAGVLANRPNCQNLWSCLVYFSKVVSILPFVSLCASRSLVFPVYSCQLSSLRHSPDVFYYLASLAFISYSIYMPVFPVFSARLLCPWHTFQRSTAWSPGLTWFVYPYFWFRILFSVLFGPAAIGPISVFRPLITDYPSAMLLWLDWSLVSTHCMWLRLWAGLSLSQLFPGITTLFTNCHVAIGLPTQLLSAPAIPVSVWPFLRKIKTLFSSSWCLGLVPYLSVLTLPLWMTYQHDVSMCWKKLFSKYYAHYFNIPRIFMDFYQSKLN